MAPKAAGKTGAKEGNAKPAKPVTEGSKPAKPVANGKGAAVSEEAKAETPAGPGHGKPDKE